MPCCYVLYSSKTKKHYIGSSRENTPHARLRSHNGGKTRSTKAGRPWIILFYEPYSEYSEARKREIFLKSGQGRKIVKAREEEN